MKAALLVAPLVVLVIVATSCLGLDVVRRWAEREHLFDIPNWRSSHAAPVPRGGGIVVAIVCLAGVVVAWFIWQDWTGRALVGYTSGAVIVALVGWQDDRRSLPIHLRLCAQAVAAGLGVLSFGFWETLELPLWGNVGLSWAGLAVTLIWTIGLTNAYNFMDGIDGIAGAQAGIAGAGWALIGWLDNQLLVSALGLVLAASNVSFLLKNWFPARIFMGDVGSTFLGYTFAILPVAASQTNPRSSVAGLLLVWPFVFDTAFTFLRRLREGENPFSAHRSHLYQRLVVAGRGHAFVTLLYAGLAAVGAALATVWHAGYRVAEPIWLAVPLLCLALWLVVTRAEVQKP